MGKIFFLILAFLVLSFSAIFFTVQADDLIPIPGDCGMLGAKCCYYKQSNVVIPKTGNGAIDGLANAFVNTLVNDILRPIFDPVKRIVQEITHPCIVGTPSTPGKPDDPSCKCVEPSVSPITALLKLCDGIKKPEEKPFCTSCLQAGGVWTGVGCIYANIKDFIQKTLLSWGIGLAGGLALLCIIYAAFMMQSSQGNPEKLKKAQELITSCIMGLMLIIFSVFILRLIGVNILRIPGFS